METYVCFIRDHTTGQDFPAVRRGPAGTHQHVLHAMQESYPAPRYTALTALTLNELEGLTKDLKRWTGMVAAKRSSTPQTNILCAG